MSMAKKLPRIAIIGAGMAGVTAALTLHKQADVTLFDKSRGIGGRMATRYADPWQFDHGAQYFTAHSAGFKTQCDAWQQQGLITPWHARFVEWQAGTIQRSQQWGDEIPHYVATPKMNALLKSLLPNDISVVVNTRITQLVSENNTWQLLAEDKVCGQFDWVLLAMPSEQAHALLQDSQVVTTMPQVDMLPCYTLMLGLNAEATLPTWDAALLHDTKLSWMSVNSHKPGRATLPSIVVHASNAWAGEHLDDDITDVQQQVFQHWQTCFPELATHVQHQALHRWRYANVGKQDFVQPYFMDAEQQLASVGDWHIKGRVESAWMSGYQCATQLKQDYL